MEVPAMIAHHPHFPYDRMMAVAVPQIAAAIGDPSRALMLYSVLEGLSTLAGTPRDKFVPNTPKPLRAARTCYDHLAGTLGVALHDRLHELNWLSDYELTPQGTQGLEELGVDVAAIRTLRRRFACPCLDWSERRPHLGGALGAALLAVALKRKWVRKVPNSRALTVTAAGRREMLNSRYLCAASSLPSHS